jgi:hypothetical protein
MATRDNTAERPLRLSFRDSRQVVVTPENEDRFVLTSKDAAQACRTGLDLESWKSQFKAFLGHINQWCEEQGERVARCYVGPSSEGLTVVVVTRGPEYQFDFDDVITQLDIELAREFPDCRADVLQSEDDDLDNLVPYISPSKAIVIYEHGEGPQKESGAQPELSGGN